MQISEIMTPQVQLVGPEDTVKNAARKMADIDAGALPVAEKDRLIGMITDRDIALRCVAQGKGADCKVREVMSPQIRYCFADDDVEAVAENMSEQQLRRLPVVDKAKRLVGIVALADIAARDSACGSTALQGVSRRGGAHNQSQAAQA